MSKTVDLVKTFKKGDRVFDICYDWGTVERVTEDVMAVKFDSIKYMIPYTQVTALTLSFTEYTLNNFSQERPINYNDYIDKWGKFWNQEEEGFSIGKLKRYHFLNKNHFFFSGRFYYDFFEPLTEEQIKFLELE